MKVKSYSIVPSGLKTDLIPIDNNKIVIMINRNSNIDEIASKYGHELNKRGINVEFEKFIHCKRPFWKFWQTNDCTLAVFTLKNTNGI